MYDYEIQYKLGVQQSHADACSCLPLPDTPSSVPIPGDTTLLIDHLNSTPVKAAQIGVWTQRDPVLSLVTRHVLQGWPSKPTNDAQKPYYNCREELSVEDNCHTQFTLVRSNVHAKGKEQLDPTIIEYV